MEDPLLQNPTGFPQYHTLQNAGYKPAQALSPGGDGSKGKVGPRSHLVTNEDPLIWPPFCPFPTQGGPVTFWTLQHVPASPFDLYQPLHSPGRPTLSTSTKPSSIPPNTRSAIQQHPAEWLSSNHLAHLQGMPGLQLDNALPACQLPPWGLHYVTLENRHQT